MNKTQLKYQAKYQSDKGITTKDDPERLLWYSAGPTCGFWTDEWDKVGLGFNQIPVCPFCGAPGYQIKAKSWFDGVARYEKDGHPGYKETVMARKDACHGGRKKSRQRISG